jgi:hypothetical protein
MTAKEMNAARYGEKKTKTRPKARICLCFGGAEHASSQTA